MSAGDRVHPGRVVERRAERERGPGSNPRDHLSRADWRFLLPRLAGARVLVLGAVGEGELSALAAADRVVVAVSGPDRMAGVRSAMDQAGRAATAAIRYDAAGPLPFRADSFDLVVVRGAPRTNDLLWPPPAHRDIGRVLRSEGVAYLETTVYGGAWLARMWMRRCLGPGHEPRTYCTVWRKGSMRAALPIDAAPSLVGYLFRSALYGRSRAGRVLTALARVLDRMRLLHHALPTRSTVAVPTGARQGAFPYVRALASRNGLDLDRHRIALLTSGAYDSNKNAFFAFAPDAARPELILKATRTPAFNHRLEQEHAALCAIQERALAQRGTYPEAVFLDRHEGLAILAEKVVDGTPFRVVTTATPECPVAEAAIDWVIELGSRSAVITVGNRSILKERFDTMLSRLAAAYDLTAAEHRFLEDTLERFGASRAELPLVFRHGDAGTWNVLVTPGGRPAFLDWELGEASGPPLWDLLDFTRSFGNWIARIAGHHDSILTYRRMLDECGPAFEYQLAAVRHYCAETGLPWRDVEPLFYFYWIDRALRQAAWTEGPLADATYIRLLRVCIRHRESPALRRLFEVGETGRSARLVAGGGAVVAAARSAVRPGMERRHVE